MTAEDESKRRLQKRFKNPHPIPEKNFFDLIVLEPAFDQFGSQITRLPVLQKIGYEMHVRKFAMKMCPLAFAPAPVNEFKEIETDADAVDAD